MFRLRSLGLVVGLSGCAAVAAEVGTGAVGSAISSATRMAERTLSASDKDNHPIELPPIPEFSPSKKTKSAEPAPMPIPVRPAMVPTPAAVPPAATPVPAVASAQFYDAEIDPRYTVRRDFGNGVGYPAGFTYLEAFVPVWQDPGESLAFLNARIVNYDDTSFWETQVGGGYRTIVDGSVLGINGFYDGRNTNNNFYHQLGFGLELLREKWEFRSNFYFPIGNTRNEVADSGFINPQFVGTNIALDRQRSYVTAMQGFDVEGGRQLPSCVESLRTYAYLGYYHYDASGVSTVDGFRARLESWYDENVSMNLAIQNDRVFNTTITGGLSLHFGGVAKGARHANPLAAKLGNRVVRDPNIVLQGSTERSTELATDPTTGKAIEVRHVNSTVPAGGNGSIENPYRTLAALQTGSATNQILFAHAGSTFNNQTITLKNGQRFLGEGIDHQFTATQGTFLLPRATANTASPLFVRTSGATNTVVLAQNNEISGLRYQRTGGIGGFIGGSGNIGAFNINRNTTTGGTSAVNFANVTGNGTIANNTFGPHSLNAVGVLQTGGALRLLIEGNQINGGLNGVGYTQIAGTNFLAFRNNRFTSAVSVIDTVFGGTETLQLRNNVGTGGYFLNRFGGTFRAENSLGTNTPTPTTFGTVNIVPVGSAGFGNP
jgi:hypothetical protein